MIYRLSRHSFLFRSHKPHSIYIYHQGLAINYSKVSYRKEAVPQVRMISRYTLMLGDEADSKLVLH